MTCRPQSRSAPYKSVVRDHQRTLRDYEPIARRESNPWWVTLVILGLSACAILLSIRGCFGLIEDIRGMM